MSISDIEETFIELNTFINLNGNEWLEEFTRTLSSEELKTLCENQNISNNWLGIRIHKECKDEVDLRMVRNCKFYGIIVFGDFDSNFEIEVDGHPFPPQVFDTTFHGTVILQSNILIDSCSLVSDVILMEGGVLFHCGSVLGSGSQNEDQIFGLSSTSRIGSESSSNRQIPHLGGLMVSYQYLLKMEIGDVESRIEELKSKVGEGYSKFSIFGPNSSIISCLNIQSMFTINSKIRDCMSPLSNCTFLGDTESEVDICASLELSDSLFCSGSCVSNGAIVRSSLILEHSEISDHATVLFLFYWS